MIEPLQATGNSAVGVLASLDTMKSINSATPASPGPGLRLCRSGTPLAGKISSASNSTVRYWLGSKELRAKERIHDCRGSKAVVVLGAAFGKSENSSARSRKRRWLRKPASTPAAALFDLDLDLPMFSSCVGGTPTQGVECYVCTRAARKPDSDAGDRGDVTKIAGSDSPPKGETISRHLQRNNFEQRCKERRYFGPLHHGGRVVNPICACSAGGPIQRMSAPREKRSSARARSRIWVCGGVPKDHCTEILRYNFSRPVAKPT